MYNLQEGASFSILSPSPKGQILDCICLVEFVHAHYLDIPWSLLHIADSTLPRALSITE